VKKKIAKQLRQRKRKIRNRLDKRTIPEHLGPMPDPGNIHYEISNRSLAKYHGKPGTGAGVEFKIKEGPMTILSIGLTAEGRFKFTLAEGESLHGPIPPTGNTNTRGFFKPDVRSFLKNWVAEGPTHHLGLGVGHHARTIQQIAEILNLESVIVTPEDK
jgi:L-arabinose isomerase